MRSLAAIATGAGASIWDVRTRRIPNALTFGSAAVALAFHAFDAGSLRALPVAVAWSVAGWIVGFLLFLPVFLLGGMGAGDVKLLAALGAWLGPGAVCWVAHLRQRGGRRDGAPADRGATRRRADMVERVGARWLLAAGWRAAASGPDARDAGNDSPAVCPSDFVGTLLTLWWRA